MPRLLAALLFLSALGLFAARPAGSQAAFPELKIALIIAFALGAAAFALERAGYRMTVAGFLFLFLAVVERRPVWLSAVLSAAFAIASFYLINDVLRVLLPTSRWGW